MNKRQAKKRYKKIHGCNPPKTASEKWRQGAVKSYNYDPEALQMAADGMRKAFREAGETIQRVAESFKKAFNEAGKKYRINRSRNRWSGKVSFIIFTRNSRNNNCTLSKFKNNIFDFIW